MTINLSVPALTELHPRIMVVGVGGAGGNAVNNMINAELEGVDFVVANTDAQSLAQSRSDRRIQLGINVTQGLGAGSNPDVGRRAAEESLPEIMEALAGSHMAFITAGMGGGTGTGAAPVIAHAAREAGILTVGVVTKPFQFEGGHRMKLADQGIEELERYVDTLIIIPNQNLFRVANEKTTFADAFKMADDVLYSGVRGVTDLMVMPGLINLDFADVRTVMAEMGKAMMGTGEAEGEGRAIDAAEAAISNPLLDEVSMKGARGVLINISGGSDMTLYEVDEAANRIRDEVDPEANIIFGSIFDETLEGRVRVSVVATGIDVEEAAQPRLHTLYPEPVAPRRHIEETEAAEPAPMPQPALAFARPQAAPVVSRPLMAQPESLPVAPAVASAGVASAATAVAMAQPLYDEPQVHQAVATATVTRPIEVRAELANPKPMAPVAKNPAPVAAQSATPKVAEAPAREPFIPPRAAAPARRGPLSKADPFAEAALSNAGAAAPKKRVRGPSLFERMTGGGRNRKEAEPEAEKVWDAVLAKEAGREAQAKRTEPRLDAAPVVKPSAAAAAKPPAPVEGNDEPQKPAAAPDLALEPEEDLLEIPAFLRRQAN
ncbi:MAG: cell division protein FtsZ [Alphaproteobacteria bacterium]